MKRATITRFASLVTLCAFIASAGAAARGAEHGRHLQERQLLGTFGCVTTAATLLPAALSQKNGAGQLREKDTLSSIGRWLHGTARPAGGGQEPYYDYYLRYDRARRLWIYIQIDPYDHSYFVGTSRGGSHGSLDGSTWRVVFPAQATPYRFAEWQQGFRVTRADLTQVCTKTSSDTMPLPVPTLTCATHRADGGTALAEHLSITQPSAGLPWWQGVATDEAGRVVYEYNIFTVGLQRVSLLVNGATGTYAIATSRLQRDLNDTSWTVVYPRPENGFTFTGVTYRGTMPTSFTINFFDGYQQCGESQAGT